MSRPALARLAALLTLVLTFGVQLNSHVAHELNRTLRGPTSAEVAALAPSLPGRILTVDLVGAEGKARAPVDFKLPLPDGWTKRRERGPEPPRALLVFVNGRPAHYFVGDPTEPSKEPYAYYKSPRATALHIRCPAGMACTQAMVVPRDWRFSATLLRSRLARFPAHGWVALAGLGSFLGVAAWAARSWSVVQASSIAGAALLALGLWVGLSLQATAWALPILALEACALGAPLIRRLGRTLRLCLQGAWAVAVAPRRDARAWLSRAFFLAVVSCAVAVPYVVTGLSWYPADRDDSFVYLRGASRLLAGGSLLRGAADRTAWVYSIYPLGLAALARTLGVHPMIAYKWLGLAGAALLPASMGLFAYAATRRLGAALLACWIGGLWGGLAGYVWLAREGLPAFVARQPPPLLDDDYYEPRFLGEYAGPHSEVTAYLCRVPLYPREAGLLLFWPALGLIYGGLPRPATRRVLGFTLLLVVCTAVYPYYGIPGLLILAWICVQEARHALRGGERARLWALLAIVAAAGLVIVGVADLMVRLHKWPSGLFAYLMDLWRRPIEDIAPSPTVRFTLPRVLGGHFFMLAAMGLAWGRRGRLREWAGFPLFLTSLALTLLAAALSRAGIAGRFLDPYGWIVPWRTLVEPVLVLGTALSVGALLDHLLRRGRSYLAAPLLLAPVVSPLHWTLNADRYLRQAAERPYGRGLNRGLYDEYARLGTRLLGTLKLREPVLVESTYVGPVEAALGVRAVGAVAQYAPLVLYPQLQGVLADKMAGGEIGDIAAVTGGAFERRLLDAQTTTPLARLGAYTVLRSAHPRGAR